MLSIRGSVVVDHRRSSVHPKVLDPSTVPADGFVPEVQLEEWVRVGLAHREGARLHFKDGRTFGWSDALRVLGRRNGESDPYGLTGKVITLRSLIRRGALIANDGFRLGAALYDVEFGGVIDASLASDKTA